MPLAHWRKKFCIVQEEPAAIIETVSAWAGAAIEEPAAAVSRAITVVNCILCVDVGEGYSDCRISRLLGSLKSKIVLMRRNMDRVDRLLLYHSTLAISNAQRAMNMPDSLSQQRPPLLPRSEYYIMWYWLYDAHETEQN